MPGNQPNGEGANQIGREPIQQAGFPLLYKVAMQSIRERPNSELLHSGEEWERWRVFMYVLVPK